MENPYAHDTLRNVLQRHDLADPTNHHVVSKKMHRKVSAAPTRILDAPDIVNDYYLQLISWGKDNILAVALAQSVYLWNAATGEIQHLTSTDTPDDYITSVSWCTIPGRTKYIAVGTNANLVEIYDAEVLRKVRTLTGHSGRVCSLAWSHQWLTSGARDSLILQHDIRCHNNVVSTYEGHEQEVCGLKWNDEGSVLASGGNENYLCIWDAAMSGRSTFQQRSRRHSSSGDSVAPRLLLTHHKAAVKALDWCPFHRGLLASGGGTADRTIKFWNSSSGAMLNSIDTGSQVCSVLWSKHQREICSSHGYSENQLILWKYPTMTKVKELTGHTERVLNMDMSPDGATVVSAAADETLRFWNVFGTPSCRPTSSSLSMSGELSFGMPTIR
jgi:cell division cycle 20, cofactor of APC complex